MYDCVTPSRTFYLYCNLPEVIYLITCCSCSLQYDGETIQKLNERFNLHKTIFKHRLKPVHFKILYFLMECVKGLNNRYKLSKKWKGMGGLKD